MFSTKLTPHAAQKRKIMAKIIGSVHWECGRAHLQIYSSPANKRSTQLLQDLIGKSGAFAGAVNGKERVIKADELENTLFFSTFAPKTIESN